LIVLVVGIALIGGAFVASRPKPPFEFLAKMELAEVEVRTEKTTGRPRRIEVYRTNESYESLEGHAKDVLAKSGWKLAGRDESPRWSEYHGGTESVEFIDDEPVHYEVKPLGVLWTPSTGGMGERRTVIYTAPAGPFDRFKHHVGSLLDRLLGNS